MRYNSEDTSEEAKKIDNFNFTHVKSDSKMSISFRESQKSKVDYWNEVKKQFLTKYNPGPFEKIFSLLDMFVINNLKTAYTPEENYEVILDTNILIYLVMASGFYYADSSLWSSTEFKDTFLKFLAFKDQNPDYEDRLEIFRKEHRHMPQDSSFHRLAEDYGPYFPDMLQNLNSDQMKGIILAFKLVPFKKNRLSSIQLDALRNRITGLLIKGLKNNLEKSLDLDPLIFEEYFWKHTIPDLFFLYEDLMKYKNINVETLTQPFLRRSFIQNGLHKDTIIETDRPLTDLDIAVLKLEDLIPKNFNPMIIKEIFISFVFICRYGLDNVYETSYIRDLVQALNSKKFYWNSLINDNEDSSVHDIYLQLYYNKFSIRDFDVTDQRKIYRIITRDMSDQRFKDVDFMVEDYWKRRSRDYQPRKQLHRLGMITLLE